MNNSHSPTSSCAEDENNRILEHAALDAEFDNWLDKVNSSSIYDLLGSSWATEARRLLNVAAHAIKRLDADLPLSSSEKHRRRSMRIREQFVLKVNQQFEALESRLQNPLITKRVDKIAFFIGVSNLWISALLIGLQPGWVPYWFTVKCILLVVVRWIIYKKKRWHYFLADMCYLVNGMLILYIHVFPTSRTLFIILYTCSHGPLSWAIVTWRNSMVFHSLDKMTSVFIHLYPSITLAVMRWIHPVPHAASSPVANSSPPSPEFFTLREALTLSALTYSVWQVAYYVLILRRRRTKVYIDGYATSFTWLIRDAGVIAKIISIFGSRFQLPLFMFLQFVYSMVTVIPTVLFARSMVLNGAFIVIMLSISIWNASTFYIDVFSSRYAADLAKLETEFKNKLESFGSPIRSPTSGTLLSQRRSLINPLSLDVESDSILLPKIQDT